MGNFRAFIPVLLALVLALGGSYLLYDWVKQKTAPDKTVTIQETAAIPVVVAKVDIPWGARINPEMLVTKPFLKQSVPADYFSNPEELAGRILISPIIAGDAVVEKRLAPTTLQSGGIPAVLEPGTRAISVKGNQVLGIAGLINPGNRVDVLVTINDPDKKEPEPITKIVLENLQVLATGSKIVENSKGQPSPVDVFTLEVTPEQGERLTLAANKGKLQFALRGVTDSEVILTKGVTVTEMLKSHMVMAKIEPKQAAPEVKTRRQVVKRAPAPKKNPLRSSPYTALNKKKLNSNILRNLES